MGWSIRRSWITLLWYVQTHASMWFGFQSKDENTLLCEAEQKSVLNSLATAGIRMALWTPLLLCLLLASSRKTDLYAISTWGTSDKCIRTQSKWLCKHFAWPSSSWRDGWLFLIPRPSNPVLPVHIQVRCGKGSWLIQGVYERKHLTEQPGQCPDFRL